MSNTLNDTMDAAKDIVDSAKTGTQHAVSSARSSLFDGIHALSSVVSMLRGLEMDDALGWVGLARRRGPLVPLALFSAGILVGAGVGVLVAPQSGVRTRRAILDALKGLEQKAEAEAKMIEQKAEHLVDKVETKVTENACAAKEAIKTKAEEAAFAVKDTLEDAKSALGLPDPFTHSDSKMGENKTEKMGESKTSRIGSPAGNHRIS